MKGKERMEGGGKAGRKQGSKKGGSEKARKGSKKTKDKKEHTEGRRMKQEQVQKFCAPDQQRQQASLQEQSASVTWTLFDTDVLWNLLESHPKKQKKSTRGLPVRSAKRQTPKLLAPHKRLRAHFAGNTNGQEVWGANRTITRCKKIAVEQTLGQPKSSCQRTVARQCPDRPWIYRAPGDTEDIKANGKKTAGPQLHSTQLPHPWQEKVAFAKPASAFIAVCDFHSKNLYRSWSAMGTTLTGLLAAHITDPLYRVSAAIRTAAIHTAAILSSHSHSSHPRQSFFSS